MFRVLSTCCLLVLCGSILHVKADASKDSKSKSKETTEESKERVKAAIDSILADVDKDKDGKLTLEELSAWVGMSLELSFAVDSQKRLEKLDTDKDGKLSWEEFLKSKENIGAATEEHKKRRFDLADEDKDGGLSVGEIISLFHPEERSHMYDVVIEEYMDTSDADNNGRISLKEYKSKMVKGDKKNYEAGNKFFKEHDKNKDANLDKEEIKEWLTSISSSVVAKTQGKQLLDVADTDKDGIVNKEEMLYNNQVFVAILQEMKNLEKAKKKGEEKLEKEKKKREEKLEKEKEKTENETAKESKDEL